MKSRGVWDQQNCTLLWWIYLKPRRDSCVFLCVLSIGWNINNLAWGCMSHTWDTAFHGYPCWDALRRLCRNWSRTGEERVALSKDIQDKPNFQQPLISFLLTDLFQRHIRLLYRTKCEVIVKDGLSVQLCAPVFQRKASPYAIMIFYFFYFPIYLQSVTSRVTIGKCKYWFKHI
jgi:hypothetical protein